MQLEQGDVVVQRLAVVIVVDVGKVPSGPIVVLNSGMLWEPPCREPPVCHPCAPLVVLSESTRYRKKLFDLLELCIFCQLET